jgi:hypothetical protein
VADAVALAAVDTSALAAADAVAVAAADAVAVAAADAGDLCCRRRGCCRVLPDRAARVCETSQPQAPTSPKGRRRVGLSEIDIAALAMDTKVPVAFIDI